MTEGLLAALRKSGASTQEAASAALQFSQALGSGVLQGDEFKSLAEAVPPLLDALAEGLQKPRSELKKLGEQGKLTTAQIVPALRDALGPLKSDAAAIEGTIGGALSGVSNAFTQLVGEAAQGSQGVRVLTAALTALADNLGAVLKVLGGIAAVMAAIKLGAFVSGIVTLSTAAVGAAGALGVLAGAMRGALALVGGPLGLAVAVASLAAAWLGLREAQDKTTARTGPSVAAERDRIAQELAQLDAEIKRQQQENKLGVAPGVLNEAALLRSRLARLDRELADLERKRQDVLLASGGPRGRTETAELRDPATIGEFEKANATREAVARKFADERAAYTKAKDIEIRLARERGDTEAEKRLSAEKRTFLAQQLREEATALRAFDRETVVTRVAEYRDLYDQRVDLARDALDREVKANQEAFEDGLRDAETYLAERARLENEQVNQQLADLERQLAGRRKLLQDSVSRSTSGLDANGRAERDDAIARQTQEIAKLEADIVKKKRDQVDAEAARLRTAREFSAEIRRQREEIDTRLAEAQGQDLTPEQIRVRVVAQYRQTLDEFARLGADQSPVFKLIDIEAARQQLSQVEREFGRVVDGLQQREAEIAQAIKSGSLSGVDGEQRMLQLRREQLPVLDALLVRMEALATTEEERGRIQTYRLRIQELKDFRAELEATARSEAMQGLSTMLADIFSRAKSGKEALLDMVRSFARALLNLATQQLVQQLFASIGGGVAGGGGASVGAAVLHSGGIAGNGGTARSAPAWLFSFAPRYHSGGIAGLKPNERAAILLAGEEVLPESDPRHAKNFRASGDLNYHATYNFQGVGGSPEEQAAIVKELDRRIPMVVRSILADEHRAGGMFSTSGGR